MFSQRLKYEVSALKLVDCVVWNVYEDGTKEGFKKTKIERKKNSKSGAETVYMASLRMCMIIRQSTCGLIGPKKYIFSILGAKISKFALIP